MKIRLPQKALYWAPPTADGRGGWTFGSYTELSCRWEGRNEMFIGPEGRQEVSRAVIYLQEPVLADGWLWLGSERTWLAEGYSSPRTDGGYKIRAMGFSPSLSGGSMLYKAML